MKNDSGEKKYCSLCLKYHSGNCIDKKGHKNKYARNHSEKSGKNNQEYMRSNKEDII